MLDSDEEDIDQLQGPDNVIGDRPGDRQPSGQQFLGTPTPSPPSQIYVPAAPPSSLPTKDDGGILTSSRSLGGPEPGDEPVIRSQREPIGSVVEDAISTHRGDELCSCIASPPRVRQAATRSDAKLIQYQGRRAHNHPNAQPRAPHEPDMQLLPDPHSSPISSSLPSVNELIGVVVETASPPNGALHGSSALAHQESVPEEDQPILDFEDVPEEFQPRKSLRKRNPIQLHPYLLESERYRKTLKGSGLRPVRLEDAVGETEDSQGQEYVDTNVHVEKSIPSSPLVPLSDSENLAAPQPRLPMPQRAAPPANTNRNLLTSVLEGSPPRVHGLAVKIGNKRRKTEVSTGAEPPLITPKESSKGFGFRLPTIQLPASTPDRDDQRARTSHPSPLPRAPAHSLPQPLVDVDSSPPLEGTGADSYPTPLASSVHEVPTIRILSSPTPSTVSVSSDDSSSDSGAKDQVFLRKYGRRMRGVLPASWLRLDHPNARSNPASKHRGLHASHNVQGPAAGVARPVSPSRRQMVPTSTSIFEDPESESTDLEQDHPWRSVAAEPVQSSLNSYVDVVRKRRHWEPPEIDPVRQVKRRSTGAKQAQKHKRPAPALSIVDAPAEEESGLSSTPQFIRLARRNARTRPDLGRRKPSDKTFRMHDARTSRDVDCTLRKWRDGILRAVNTPLQKRPRQPRPIPSAPRYPAHEQRAYQSAQLPFSPVSDTHQNRRESEPSPVPSTSRNNKRETASVKREDDRNVQSISRIERPRPRPPVPTAPQPRSIQLERSTNSRLPRSVRVSRAELRRVRTVLLGRDIISTAETPLPLARYLQESEEQYDDPPQVYEPPSPITPTALRQLQKPLRKQIPRFQPWVDRHPEVLDSTHEAEQELPVAVESSTILRDLLPYGEEYSLDFGILPFQLGTFFDESTYLGSGCLVRALGQSRDLDTEVEVLSFSLGNQLVRWGAWSEMIAQELGTLFKTGEVREESDGGWPRPIDLDNGTLHCLSEYVARFLFFTDPIDREGCIHRLQELITQLVNTLAQRFLTNQQPVQEVQDGVLRSCALLLVLSTQVAKISDHPLVESRCREDAQKLVTAAASLVMQMLVLHDSKTSSSDVSTALGHALQRRDLLRVSANEETWVIVHQCLRDRPSGHPAFWTLINEAIGTDALPGSSTAADFERIWSWQLRILPLLEIGMDGVHSVGARFQAKKSPALANWKPISSLVERVFSFTRAGTGPQGSTFNAYCRITIARCIHLIQGWGWVASDIILGALFDAFAAQDLGCLRHETAHGSPRFIQKLHGAVNISIEVTDTSYQLFLKLVAVGIRSLTGAVTAKKMNNAVFRLVPNHGRHYPKEDTVKQDNLDSLKNHFDLLTVLHWAAPPSSRPQLNVISQLIDPDSSHREAVRISIQTWTNLIRFQITSGENQNTLRAFVSWHTRLVHSALRQHRMARVEVETQATTIRSRGTAGPSSSHIEKIIQQNQAQVEIILIDLILALRTAISLAPTPDDAMILLEPSSTTEILTLFSTSQSRNPKVLNHLLDFLRDYCHLCLRQPSSQNSQEASNPQEDSQDSWSFLTLLPQPLPCKSLSAAQHYTALLHRPLFQLLSSTMGSPSPTLPDSSLTALTTTWALTTTLTTTFALHSWSAYLGPFGACSWSAFQPSVQNRAFFPLFLASCVRAGAMDVDPAIRGLLIRAWVGTLLEREARLRFQHVLTKALLDAMREAGDPLFFDVPFPREEGESGGYVVTLQGLKERRALLVSVLLEKMGDALKGRARMTLSQAGELKGECEEVVGVLMEGLKGKVLEMGEGVVGGAYVEFVKAIVGAGRRFLGEMWGSDAVLDALVPAEEKSEGASGVMQEDLIG